MAVKTDSGIDYLLELADRDGIAVTSVTDGHVFVLTRKHVQGILKMMDDKVTDRAVIFVKRAAPIIN